MLSRNQQPVVRSQLIAAAAQGDTAGFARATGPIPLSFPKDFGPHPDYQTEWWYYTGNLETPDGQHFGYQLTFFRRALLPPDRLPKRTSDWAVNQVYMAHFALTDVAAKQYHAYERLERGAAGLAGAQAVPFQVWLDNWSVEAAGAGKYRLKASQAGINLDLTLVDSKGPVLQGDQGYSRKGAEPGQASYYYSLTRLVTSGSVHTQRGTFDVTGLSWMDHEFSTSYLSKDQVGWDWFALQLNDDTELMVFKLRRADGSTDPASSGTVIHPDGSTISLSAEDFRIQVQDTWTSPHTGAKYPSHWTITVPKANLQVTIQPYLDDQELNVSYSYWEGAVHFQGTLDGKSVEGSGYIELTGYAAPMGGQF